MVKKISFEKYSKYTEQQEAITKEIEQLREELEEERSDEEIIENWEGEGGAKGAKHYLMKEIIANYCEKVSGLNYELFSPEMGVLGSFITNENDKKIAVIKTLLDNHQKIKEFSSAPKKENESDLIETIREVYQEKSATIDNSIQQLEDELIILNISNKGSRERIMKLVNSSRGNENASPANTDAGETERLWQENNNLHSQLEKLQVEQNSLEILKEENSQLKELLREMEKKAEGDIKRQERQLSKWEEDQEKNIKEADQKTAEALAQLAENKEKLTNLRKEAKAKEKEIANLQADRERLEGEITEKNEKIDNLRKRIGELSREKRENKELEKQIADLTDQLAEAERLKTQAEAEKNRVLERLKAAQEALNNLNNELESQREAMNAQIEQLMIMSNQIQQKYQKILISLGFSEEEIGEDVVGFLTKILGQKNTGENTTLKDIREISEVNSLQDLIEVVKQLESEIARQKQIESQSKQKSKSASRRTLSLVVNEKEIKSLQEEMENQEEKWEDLSDKELAKRLESKKKEKDLFYSIKRKGERGEIIQEKRSLITDTLQLFANPAEKEAGRATALTILAPVSQPQYLEKLQDYQSVIQPELIAGIIQNFQQRLAQQVNLATAEPTPAWAEGFLVKDNERLKKELVEKENENIQLKENQAYSEKFLQKLVEYLQKDEDDCLEIAAKQAEQKEKEAWQQKRLEYQVEKEKAQALIEVVKNR